MRAITYVLMLYCWAMVGVCYARLGVLQVRFVYRGVLLRLRIAALRARLWMEGGDWT